MLRCFDFYTQELKWEIIPILPNSKAPFMRGWNKEYDQDNVRSYLESHPWSNIGLRLGKILDIEADTPNANDLLDNLTKNCVHPMYKSEKSIHHLFTSPYENLTRIVISGIEFRGNLHQSLLPPSVNASGLKYTWLVEPSLPLPYLPESLINIYNNNIKGSLFGKDIVRPWCSKCNNQSRSLHWKRYRLEVKAFEVINKKWECHRCRTIDVRPICRKLRKITLSI